MTQKCSCHGSGDKHSQTVAAVLERPRYSPGLVLEDSDLTSAVDYTRSLSRLLFRNLFGCGVICGLVVTAEKDCGLAIKVAPGLALDGCGDPIEVPAPIIITLDKTELEALESRPQDKWPVEFWVVLCGGEKMCAPRPLVCEADEFDNMTQPTRIRALAEVSLAFDPPECACACRLRNLPVQQYANMAPSEDEFDCQYDHEHRIACAPDCGCGTACACACCLLLAHVRLVRLPGGQLEWQTVNRGVRRFIRPQLLEDPVDRKDGEVWGRSQAAAVYWDDIDDSGRHEAVRELYPKMRAGDMLTRNQIGRIVEFSQRKRAAQDDANAKAVTEAAAAEPESEAKAKAKTGAEARKKSRAAAKVQPVTSEAEQKSPTEEKK